MTTKLPSIAKKTPLVLKKTNSETKSKKKIDENQNISFSKQISLISVPFDSEKALSSK